MTIAMLTFSCSSPQEKINADSYLEKGEFSLLQNKIDSLRTAKTSQWTSFELDSLEQVMHGIRSDFSKSEVEMRDKLQEEYPEASDIQIEEWERSGKLEMRIIDGEKRYFGRAVLNLQRMLAFDEAKVKQDGYDVASNSLTALRLAHTKEAIDACTETTNTVLPQKITFTYTLKVKPNAVPDGETIRCWLPALREGNPRQTDFEILESEPKNYTLAPNDYLQRSLYMEKKAIKDEPTLFSVKYSVITKAQYFDLKLENIQPYDTNSEIYKHNTTERPPHIIFTSEIRDLAKQIVGDETNPVKKVEAIYSWISNNIPWASALEYGNIANIPHYMLTNRHGDCGMHTLLFMTLARSQGIPVKWQSGFMIHPGNDNLHDWGEVYYEGIGWVPVDQSFKLQPTDDEQVRKFYFHGIDAYRLIVNDDFGMKLYPEKTFPRSEPYDFQRGEVEWKGGNLYFDKWNWNMEVGYN